MAEDGRAVWRVITYKNGSRTKDDELPLGFCPKCGADLIEYLA